MRGSVGEGRAAAAMEVLLVVSVKVTVSGWAHLVVHAEGQVVVGTVARCCRTFHSLLTCPSVGRSSSLCLDVEMIHLCAICQTSNPLGHDSDSIVRFGRERR